MVFEYNLEANLQKLADDLASGGYVHGGYKYFSVNDSKKRLVAVASVRDRVVHRLLYEYLEASYDKLFLYQVWSCRTGKGLAAGVDELQRTMSRYRNGWLWRSDVLKFFDSVDQDILLALLRRRLGNNTAFWLCNQVVKSYAPTDIGRQYGGVPIGNLTSQIFANIYFHEFDRYMMHELKPLGYLRYGDDIVSWWSTQEEAKRAEYLGTEFLQSRLHLALNDKVSRLQPTTSKLHMLGLELWPSGRRLDVRMRNRLRTHQAINNYASYRALVQRHDAGKLKQFDYQAIEQFDSLF